MKHIFKTLLIASLALFIVAPAFAVEKTTEVKVEPNEIVIAVQGIVCSFCAQGVQKKLSKLSFVDPSKYTKGIKVDIEGQQVTMAIKPNTKADLAEIFASIKSGGYEPVTAHINENGNGITTYTEEEK